MRSGVVSENPDFVIGFEGWSDLGLRFGFLICVVNAHDGCGLKKRMNKNNIKILAF